MKGMSLVLVCVVLLLGFAGFAYAEADNVSDSFENDTVVDVNETELVNETDLDENQTEQVEDGALDGNDSSEPKVVQDKESFFDGTVSYVGGVVNKINEIHENLFFMVIIILGVLLLFMYSIFFDYSSADNCFSKASSLHRNGEKAHVSGNYAKAKKLYGKSYLFRKMGEEIVSGGADDNAI
jgi:hypothetical protein